MVAIRLERPDDALAIAGVHVRAWQAGYAGIMPAEVLDRLNVAAWAQRRRERGTAEPEHPFRTLVATVPTDGTPTADAAAAAAARRQSSDSPPSARTASGRTRSISTTGTARS